MNIIEHRMAYEGASKLLELAKAYHWSVNSIRMMERTAAELKDKLDAAEREWAV